MIKDEYTAFAAKVEKDLGFDAEGAILASYNYGVYEDSYEQVINPLICFAVACDKCYSFLTSDE